MRPKYYRRLFGQMRMKKSFVLFMAFILFIYIMCATFIYRISPVINTMCNARAKAIALNVTNQAIREYMEELKYDNLVTIKTGEDGKIIGLSANIVEMNKLSSKLAGNIQGKLLSIKEDVLSVPIGQLLGWSIFSGYGPMIDIKVIPVGNVEIDFKTEFKAEGINQTRHRIYIQVQTSVLMVAPFVSDTVQFADNVTVAETVIIGEIPSTYFNIDGLEGLKDINQLGD